MVLLQDHGLAQIDLLAELIRVVPCAPAPSTVHDALCAEPLRGIGRISGYSWPVDAAVEGVAATGASARGTTEIAAQVRIEARRSGPTPGSRVRDVVLGEAPALERSNASKSATATPIPGPCEVSLSLTRRCSR